MRVANLQGRLVLTAASLDQFAGHWFASAHYLEGYMLFYGVVVGFPHFAKASSAYVRFERISAGKILFGLVHQRLGLHERPKVKVFGGVSDVRLSFSPVRGDLFVAEDQTPHPSPVGAACLKGITGRPYGAKEKKSHCACYKQVAPNGA